MRRVLKYDKLILTHYWQIQSCDVKNNKFVWKFQNAFDHKPWNWFSILNYNTFFQINILGFELYWRKNNG